MRAKVMNNITKNGRRFPTAFLPTRVCFFFFPSSILNPPSKTNTNTNKHRMQTPPFHRTVCLLAPLLLLATLPTLSHAFWSQQRPQQQHVKFNVRDNNDQTSHGTKQKNLYRHKGILRSACKRMGIIELTNTYNNKTRLLGTMSFLSRRCTPSSTQQVLLPALVILQSKGVRSKGYD